MKKFIKFSSAVCAALLTVLGFSALATSCTKYGIPVMYGMPSVSISGKVTDKNTGKPIKGIQVTNLYAGFVPMYGVPPGDYTGSNTPAFTDTNGDYTIYGERIYSDLSFEDVDGEANGLYNDTTVTVDIRNIALTPKN